MKHLSRILLVSLFLFGLSNVQAQDENNPWAVGIGINAVDFYPVGEDAPQGGMFSEYFNAGDHYNVLPSVSRLTVGRYVGSGFSVQLAGSVNKIDKFGDANLDDLSYYAADGAIRYSFKNLINEEGWFDPYLGIGGGYAWIDEDGQGSANGTLGFDFWLTDNIAFNIQSTYKKAFDDETGLDHFQHSAGFKLAFGGKDTDGDGVFDKNDKCPETPGLAEFDGCPDSDGDGIQDSEDDCPNTPGMAEFNGCPDTDGDGIADPQDECPTVAGLKSLNGCPDADGDGIKDSEDECPNEAGPAANNGCPYQDRDNDGVLDKDDQCPDVAGTKANNGCPEVTVEVINELNEYSKTILFDLGKASIRKESYEALKSIAEIMEEYPSTVFHIEGHTDSQGSEKFNLKLSDERAGSVRTYLTEQANISSDRITSEGYGEARPIATNKTAAGRQQNRRVEVSLEKNRDQE
ncbi:outer membrane protein OmpA-like peptidoglycan-associated protein [Mesonia algae]|uniref:Outer membrane protein OmpA-like peptidoglycan-associated protein n=1 Tax=Mesonia algae TaxID=213248 RepID=A0A2W7I538_9FLAO|nr:OmpA family protein [Mesonia algae]PZW41804.1 outer membrane protein OmpA-like peptidoglycan-associated protein [Mesonia algae]